MPLHRRFDQGADLEQCLLDGVLPLVRPFRASHGTTTTREVLLVRVRTTVGDGWGECSAEAEPTYTAEYTDAAAHVLRHHLAPRLLAAGPVDALGGQVAALLGAERGDAEARAALDTAVLDAQLRAAGRSLAEHLGATAADVEAGVVVGIMDDPSALLDVVAGLHEHDLPHPDGGLLGPELGQLTHVGQLGHLA